MDRRRIPLRVRPLPPMPGQGMPAVRLHSVLTVAIALAFLVSGLAVAVGTFHVMAEAEQRLEAQAMEGHAAVWRQTLAADFQRMLAEVTGITRDAPLIDALVTGQDVAPLAQPKFNRLRATGVATRIVVMDREGRRVFDSGTSHPDDPMTIGLASLQDGRFHQGIHHERGSTYYASLAVPLFRGGKPVGSVVLLRDLATEALVSLAAALDAGVAIVDAAGVHAMTAPGLAGDLPARPIEQRVAAQRIGSRDVHRLVVSLPLVPFARDTATANVVVFQDISGSVAAQRFINSVTLGAALLVLVLTLTLLHYGLRGVLRPLGKAVQTLNDVGQGRFDSDIRPDSFIREIAALQHSAQTMVGRLRRMIEVEENARLAFRDSLTHLANRRLLMERLAHAVESSRDSQANAALILIDLDHFKTLNDTRGHSSGDQLLIVIGRRIEAAVRSGDTVARFGGDEFVVLLEHLCPDVQRAKAEARRVAETLIRRIREPVPLGTFEHVVSGSVGITLFPQAGGSPEELLKQVDFAMYQAKQQGRDGIRFYDPELQGELRRQADLEQALRRALQCNALRIDLQPQVDASGRIHAAEALLRWPRPDGTQADPSEFVRVAELSGQMAPLGRVALLEACRALRRWAEVPELRHLSIAVNCSASQITQPLFLPVLDSILAETGAPPERLHIELTESVMADFGDTLMANLKGLRERGCRLAIDDFGTGYSSLTYLKQLPLDYLKIDRSFVVDVERSAGDASIAQMVIAIARLMGLGVIAEGVETPAQRAFLVRHGCPLFQGYLFHAPMSIEDFERSVIEQGAAWEDASMVPLAAERWPQ